MPSEGETIALQNDRFVLEIDPGARTLALEDRVLRRRWTCAAPFVRVRVPGPPQEEFPYWGHPDPSTEAPWRPEQLVVEAARGAARLRLSHIDVGGAAVDVALSIRLERDRVRFEVNEVAGLPPGREVIVDFPWRLGAATPGDEGALVIPRGAGILADFSRQREGHTFENLIYSGGQNGFSHPIYGTIAGGVILGAIIKTPFDCILRAELNSGEPATYSEGPCWLFEGGRLTYPRRVDYAAFRGGYVELARWYRADLIAAGRCRTLREKAERHPLVPNLDGAVLAEMRLDLVGGCTGKGRTPYELVDTAVRMGFPGVVAFAVGVWQRPFYGTRAVPPEEGTEEDLARAARYGRSKGEAYDISVYENFVDMWPSTPGYDPGIMAKRRDGSVRPNWYSAQFGMRSSTVCSVHRLETARRDLPHLKELIGPGSIYVDVEGAMELNECFDAVHPLGREQDAHYRSELLDFTGRLFGSVATESMPMDCLADAVDIGAYFPVYQFIGYGCSDKPRLDPPMIPIPLFPLIYHGSVFHMNPKAGDFYTCDALYVPLWGMMADETDEFSLRVSKDMRGTAYATMEDHRFVTAPKVETGERYHAKDAQFSRFSDGTCVLANFSAEPVAWEGHSVGPNDWVMWRE